MRIELSKNRPALVRVFFGTEKKKVRVFTGSKRKNGKPKTKTITVKQRTTTVDVATPEDVNITGRWHYAAKVVCNHKDNFCRRTGRIEAMKRLFQENYTAFDRDDRRAIAKALALG
jgi:hypothetical protein